MGDQFLLELVQPGLEMEVLYLQLIGVASAECLSCDPIGGFARLSGGATSRASVRVRIAADLAKLSYTIS